MEDDAELGFLGHSNATIYFGPAPELVLVTFDDYNTPSDLHAADGPYDFGGAPVSLSCTPEYGCE
ncbi:MAG: hypothetical protein ACI8PZ_005418 [Myxococcota bacterium]|jgi:hypothetical protein